MAADDELRVTDVLVADDPDWDEPEIKPARQVRREPKRAEADDRLTEAGAAERFNRLHGDAVRFDHRRGRWLMWERHRWIPDADAGVTRLALDFARAWQREAVEIPDRDRREAVFKAAVRLERRDALQSMLALAHDLKPIADAGDHWDMNPWLLGAPNGVIDLRTGILRPGKQEDGITMNVAVPYDPHARCPRWQQFLVEVFAKYPELVAFARRAAGYSIVGLTSEQCLLLLHGTGSNGKSTFVITITFVLGDYAWNMPFTTIELRDRGAIPNDLAALVGRRFVIASETNDGTRLNESRVKALVAGDPTTARFLHREFFTFEPVATFWLSVNHRPIVRDDSFGFWRRMRLVPFTEVFSVNAALADKLRVEASGILAWAVQGCLEWQQQGLNPPPVVLEATREYELESDPLSTFIAEAIDLDPKSECPASDLYEHYKVWASRQHLGERERLTMTAFGRKLGERFPSRRVHGSKRYQGLSRRLL